MCACVQAVSSSKARGRQGSWILPSASFFWCFGPAIALYSGAEVVRQNKGFCDSAARKPRGNDMLKFKFSAMLGLVAVAALLLLTPQVSEAQRRGGGGRGGWGGNSWGGSGWGISIGSPGYGYGSGYGYGGYPYYGGYGGYR